MIVSLNGDPLAELGTSHAGGQCRYILELGKKLVGAGWFIEVITIKNAGCSPREKVTEGFYVTRIPRPSGADYGYDITLGEVHDLADRCGLDHTRIKQYAAVLCCYWLSGVFWIRTDPAHTRPRIITFCSLGEFKFTHEPSEEVKLRISTEKILAKSFDRVIATNRLERDTIVSTYGADSSQVKLIPRGISLELFGGYDKPPVCR